MKLLIEIPSWMGDAVMATPAIENLVKIYNNPKIILIGSFISTETLKNHPNIYRTIILDKKIISLIKIAKNLGKFDAFFTFRSSFRAKFLKICVQADYKYQFNKNKYKNRHQVEKYNDFINDSLKIDLPAGRLKIVTKDSKKNNTKQILGINPGASYGSSKRWYPQKFAEVVENLSKQFDIVIFGSTNETEIANEIEKTLISKGVNNFQNLAGKTSITELVKCISNLDLLITNDSGPMHLAASFQIPTISIFGPTRDNETSQWLNIHSVIIKKNLICQPCMKRTCPLNHHNCMKLITPKEVIEAIPDVYKISTLN
jgi:heptosyltransferase II